MNFVPIVLMLQLSIYEKNLLRYMEAEVNFHQGSHRWTNRYQLESRGHHSEGYDSQIFKISNPNFEGP